MGTFPFFLILTFGLGFCEVIPGLVQFESRATLQLESVQEPPAVPEVCSTQEESTIIKCAKLCVKDTECKNFIWAKETKACLLGFGCLHQHIPGQTQLFVKVETSSCHTSMGYEIRKSGLATMCVQLLTVPQNFILAKSKCETRQGSLAVTDTQDKIDIVIDMTREEFGQDTNFTSVAIGLNDLDMEDIFVWSDGRIMTSEERLLFDNLEPSGYDFSGTEDWVEIRMVSRAFNDIPTFLLDAIIPIACEVTL